MTHYTSRHIAGQLPYSLYILLYQRVANYPEQGLPRIRLYSENCKAWCAKHMMAMAGSRHSDMDQRLSFWMWGLD